MRPTSPPTLSIVIPAKDEAGAIVALMDEIRGCGLTVPFEFVVVDDGSTDGTSDVVIAAARPDVCLLRHEVSGGKSRAVRAGVLAARGDLVITIDGDGQNDPQYLVPLLAPLLEDPEVGLVAGQRTRRHDGFAKKLVSKIANRMRRALLADDTRDTACGLKAMRREVYLLIPFFDNNHRFLPALIMREGWKIAHVPVVDRPRTTGKSKYGILDRALVGLPDLLGVWWLRRRSASRPVAQKVMEFADE